MARKYYRWKGHNELRQAWDMTPSRKPLPVRKLEGKELEARKRELERTFDIDSWLPPIEDEQ